MPATAEEFCGWIRGLLDGAIMPDTEPVWADGSRCSQAERTNLLALLQYEARRRGEAAAKAKIQKAQRKALGLLRGFLTATQREQFQRCRYFDVTTPTARIYRFIPSTASIHEVERHGKRLYAIRSFCLHEPPLNEEIRNGVERAATLEGIRAALDLTPPPLPPADITLAQLLLLSHSEAEFLATANATERRNDMLWNGEWQRRLRRAQREREEARRGRELEAAYEGYQEYAAEHEALASLPA